MGFLKGVAGLATDAWPQELSKRVALLEKMVLRQQVTIEELLTRVEAAEVALTLKTTAKSNADAAVTDDIVGACTSALAAEGVKKGADIKVTSPQQSVDDTLATLDSLLDDDLRSDIARAYGEGRDASANIGAKPAVQNAAGSYLKAQGGKLPRASDNAKQNEATKQKLEGAVKLAVLDEKKGNIKEKSPDERLADFSAEYNGLYDVKGTLFTRKKAQDDFIRKYAVQGMKCSNYELRLSRPELEPRFVAVAMAREADYWGMPLGNNLFAVVPSVNLVYNEECHVAGGMREAFQSNFRRGKVYQIFTVCETATFQFGTVGKVFKRGLLEIA